MTFSPLAIQQAPSRPLTVSSNAICWPNVSIYLSID